MQDAARQSQLSQSQIPLSGGTTVVLCCVAADAEGVKTLAAVVGDSSEIETIVVELDDSELKHFRDVMDRLGYESSLYVLCRGPALRFETTQKIRTALREARIPSSQFVTVQVGTVERMNAVLQPAIGRLRQRYAKENSTTPSATGPASAPASYSAQPSTPPPPGAANTAPQRGLGLPVPAALEISQSFSVAMDVTQPASPADLDPGTSQAKTVIGAVRPVPVPSPDSSPKAFSENSRELSSPPAPAVLPVEEDRASSIPRLSPSSPNLQMSGPLSMSSSSQPSLRTVAAASPPNEGFMTKVRETVPEAALPWIDKGEELAKGLWSSIWESERRVLNVTVAASVALLIPTLALVFWFSGGDSKNKNAEAALALAEAEDSASPADAQYPAAAVIPEEKSNQKGASGQEQAKPGAVEPDAPGATEASDSNNKAPREEPKIPGGESALDQKYREYLAVDKALRSPKVRGLDAMLVSTQTSRKLSYKRADRLCDRRSTEELDGWRLPTSRELQSLSRANMLGKGYYWAEPAKGTRNKKAPVWDSKKSKFRSKSKSWRGAKAVCVRSRSTLD